MTSIFEVTTPRLRFGQWTSEAVASLHTMHNNSEVQRYLDADRTGWSEDKAHARAADYQKEFDTLGLGKFPMFRRSDGAFIGRAGFSALVGMSPELGYSLDYTHWGQGYASEIALALRDWYFANRAESHFIAFAHTGNLASQRVLEKIGMEPTHQAEFNGMLHQYYILNRPVL